MADRDKGLPVERVTDQELEARQAELLKDLPEEFRGKLSYMAYERGHSSGNEEILICLQNLVSDLEEPIRKYGERVRKEAGIR